MAIPKFFAISLALILMASCSKHDKPDVVVLHSGRMRGNVYPLSLQNIAPLQHYQYMAGYIRKVREEAARSGAKVFVVDLGDSLSGSFAAHVTDSANMVAFFNEAGYDVVQLSNLDAQVSPDVLRHLKAKVLTPFEFPEREENVRNLKAGARLELGDLPLFFLANFYGNTDPESYPERFPVSFGSLAPNARAVRDYGKVLESLGPRPQDSLTLLGWMKFESNAQVPPPFLQELDRLHVDAILAHRVYNRNEREAWQPGDFMNSQPPVSLNILRNNGGFALARMDLIRTSHGWKVLSHQLVPMTANNAPVDDQIIKDIDQFTKQVKAADVQLFELAQPFSEDQILEVYMAALTTLPGSQAVAYSRESIRSDWSPGPLHASEVFKSLPWTTGLVQLKITRAQLADIQKFKRLCVAVDKSSAQDPIILTTSQFFGKLIARQLGIAQSEITALPQSSEFDFFLGYLKEHPGFSKLGKTWEISNP